MTIRWRWLLPCVLLAGCAAAPRAPQDERYFHDARFRPAGEAIRVDDVFALSPAMREYLDTEVLPRAVRRGRQNALVDVLYTQGDLKLEYDSEMTRNAAQAFAARSGNCLSLVIMTAAFAKALDLPVHYQKVFVDDEWARSGDLYLAIGHVNLVLGKRKTDEGGYGYRVGRKPFESEGLTIDFLPPDDMRRLRTVEIGEDAIVAMYMNNRAVEALARDRVDDAYWWARASVAQSTEFLAAYNTLGAVYQRHGDLPDAQAVLRFVLAREPANTQAMANLVAVLRDGGQVAEADALAAQLAKLEPEPAFVHFNRGVAAFERGDFATAKDAFAREVARAPDYHEFQFWLGVTLLRLGDTEAARRHLALAVKNSTTRRDHDLYAAKLDRLLRPSAKGVREDGG
ncbi:MAG: tetratricopeptide repeat protein [Burkholderiales bacterium]